MLNRLRTGATSLFVKLLLLLIMVSFIVWGVGDMLKHGNAPVVAKLGSRASITQEELDRAVKQEIARLQAALGESLPADKLNSLQLPYMLLQQLVSQRLLAIATEDLKLAAGDNAVIREIRQNPQFQNEQHQFDKKRFDALLHANNLSEAHYIQSIRQDLAHQFLIQTLATPVIAPQSAINATYQYRKEQRDAEILIIPSSYALNVTAPTDSALQQYYDSHKEDWMAAEVRAVSYITMQSKDLATKVAISESELQTAYQERLPEYKTPEKRTVEHLVFTSEEEAKTALSRIKSGSLLPYAKQTLGKTESDVVLASILKTDLPKEAQDKVFELKKSTTSAPIQSPLGWHLFRVTQIEPSHTASFEEVRDTLKESLIKKKAETGLYSLATKIDDALAGGSTLEETAHQHSISVRKLPSVTNDGKDASGTAMTLPASETLLSLTFSTDKGETSPFTLSKDKQTYIAVRVDEITPSHARIFNEVKEEVQARVVGEAKKNALQKFVKDIHDQLAKGAKLQELAKQHNLSTKTALSLTRPSPVVYAAAAQTSLPDSLLQGIFRHKLGEVTGPVEAQDGGYMIASVAKITPALDAPTEETVTTLRRELQEQYAADIVDLYLQHLRNQYPVRLQMKSLPAPVATEGEE